MSQHPFRDPRPQLSRALAQMVEAEPSATRAAGVSSACPWALLPAENRRRWHRPIAKPPKW